MKSDHAPKAPSADTAAARAEADAAAATRAEALRREKATAMRLKKLTRNPAIRRAFEAEKTSSKQLAEKLAAAENLISAAEARIAELEANFQSARITIKSLETANADLNAAADAFARTHATAVAQVNELEAKLAAQAEQYAAAEKEITAARTTIQSLEAANATLKDSNAALTADLAAAKNAAALAKKSTK